MSRPTGQGPPSAKVEDDFFNMSMDHVPQGWVEAQRGDSASFLQRAALDHYVEAAVAAGVERLAIRGDQDLFSIGDQGRRRCIRCMAS